MVVHQAEGMDGRIVPLGGDIAWRLCFVNPLRPDPVKVSRPKLPGSFWQASLWQPACKASP